LGILSVPFWGGMSATRRVSGACGSKTKGWTTNGLDSGTKAPAHGARQAETDDSGVIARLLTQGKNNAPPY